MTSQFKSRVEEETTMASLKKSTSQGWELPKISSHFFRPISLVTAHRSTRKLGECVLYEKYVPDIDCFNAMPRPKTKLLFPLGFSKPARPGKKKRSKPSVLKAAASVEDHPPKLSQSRITEPGPPRARSILSITRIRPGTPSQERPTTPPASPKPHKSSGRCKCCRCCQKRKAKSISYSALPAAPEPPYPVAPAHSLPSLPRTHGLSEERVIAVTFPERSVSLFADLSELDARPPPKPARSLARKPAFSRRAVVETLSVHPSELGSAILADYAKPSLRRRAKSSTSLSSRLGRPPSVKASRSQPTLRVTYLASSDDELHTEAPSLPETPFLAKVIPEPGNAAQEASRTPMEATPGPSVTQDGNQKMSTVTDAGVSLLPSERDALLSPEISPRNPFMHVSTLPSTSSRPRSHTPKMVQPRTKLLQRHVQRDDTRPPPVLGARWVQLVFKRRK